MMPGDIVYKIAEMRQQIEALKKEMLDTGATAISIAYVDKVVQPAWELMMRAQDSAVPIPDVDEAIVSTLSAVIFDYLQRIHQKKKQAAEHFALIGQDVTERVAAMIESQLIEQAAGVILPPADTVH